MRAGAHRGGGARKAVRPDDARRGPHSPEHRAKIMLGIARTNWSQRQSQRASRGEPHTIVPVDERTIRAFAAVRPNRVLPKVGDCHWCWVWNTLCEHNDEDPRP